ncbi:hypothetical protein ACIQI7_38675 [Kitasatospora sp. NPDC092039]|uniref:hypothetical protein n=1 Tax=Kitasatospora sp. NPDC092039 TaxID=3364086 RepID=UPI0037FC34C5
MTSADHILALVRTALDEFDDRPLSVSVRRAVRIASLVGDTEVAIRLGYELRPSAGDPRANAKATKRLMADPSSWGSMDGPAAAALREYLNDRSMNMKDPEALIAGHSLEEMEYLLQLSEGEVEGPSVRPDLLERTMMLRTIRDLTRHRTFTYLCEWERRFNYSSINDTIFGNYKTLVDRLLSTGVPGLVEQFTAVYRRLNEAAASDPERPVTEELAQAITTCRRILESVVDHVLPAQDEPSATGHRLDQSAYRNRLFEFIKRANQSGSTAEMTVALTEGLHDRYTAVGKLTNKGVHATLALRAANLCALNTYIVCGEILQLKDEVEKP